MPRSKLYIRLFAFIAVLAWSNVQAMACCWTMKPSVTVKSVKVHQVSGDDYSCCPGEEEDKGSAQPETSATNTMTHGCETHDHGSSALCCTHLDPAEDAVSAPQFSFVQLILFVIELPALPEKSPPATSPFLSFASSGPPRYLALERILI